MGAYSTMDTCRTKCLAYILQYMHNVPGTIVMIILLVSEERLR